MKKHQGVVCRRSVPPLLILAALALTLLISSVRAQPAPVLVAGGGVPEGKPRQGVAFWSLQLTNHPPMPVVPFDGLDVYEAAPGQFYYDDRKVDYAAVRAEWAKQAAEHAALQAMLGFAENGPLTPALSPAAGAREENGGGAMSLLSFGSNDLWLEILGTNDPSPLILHNSKPGTNYQILTRTAFDTNAWVIERGLVGAYGDTDTPFTVPQWGRTNLFFWAREAIGPTVHITSPAPGTVAQPLPQVTGHSEEPLRRLTYELFNGGVSIGSGSGFVLGAAYDPVWRRYSTNVFQLFDLRLQPGTNTLVLTAVNPAGQTNIFTYEYVLNLALDQTPPVLTHLWPPDGAWVSGASFTLRGVLDDPATSVHLLLVASGLTNEFYGVVERTGQFWVDALPLAPGTNTLLLIATDAAGNSTTNLSTVRGSSLLLAVTTNTTDLASFNQDSPGAVTGLLDSTNYTVWVNGVRAVFTSATNWIAYNVPTDRGGVGLLQVIAIPNDDNDGNGTGGGAYSVADPGNPSATNGVQFAHEWEKPSFHYTAGWTNNYAFTIPFFDTNNPPVETQQHQWAHGGGGSGALSGPRAPGCAHLWENLPDGGLTNSGYWCGGQLVHTSTGVEVQGHVARVLDAELSGAHPPDWDSLGASFVGTARSRTAYRVGGRAIPGELRLFLGSANVTGYTVGADGDGFYYDRMNPSDPLPVPRDSGFPLVGASIAPDQITMLGETLDANYEMRTLVPVALLDTTLAFAAEAPPARIGGVNAVDDQVRIYMLKSSGSEDVTDKTNVVWVGEAIDLICGPKRGNTGMILSNFNWTIPGQVVSNFFVSSDSRQTNGYPIELPASAYTNAFIYYHWVRGPGGEVKCRATVAGRRIEPKTTFDVRNVDANWIGAIASPVAVNNAFWGVIQHPQVPGPWLHFGIGTVNTNNGVTFTLTNVNLNGFPPARKFYFQCVQVGNNTRQFTKQGTNVLFVGNGLDSVYPYRQYPDRAVAGVDGDSPGAPCYPDYSSLNKANAFDTYLMWRPSDVPSIPVPLKLLKWSWSGTATNSSGIWSLIGSNALIIQNNAPTSAFPQWTNNCENVSITITP